MKTNLIFFMTLLFLCSGFSEASHHSSPVVVVRPKVIIRITLGAPPPDCTRFGICQIDILPGWLRAMPGQAIAECTTDENGKLLQITIDSRSGIDAETKRKFFNGGYFVTESEVVLSPDISNALQISPGKLLRAGRWEVTEVNGFLSFSIPLN